MHWLSLVNKITYVSGVQLNNKSSVYFIMCSLPQVKSPSITFYPLLKIINIQMEKTISTKVRVYTMF